MSWSGLTLAKLETRDVKKKYVPNTGTNYTNDGNFAKMDVASFSKLIGIILLLDIVRCTHLSLHCCQRRGPASVNMFFMV